MARVYNKITLKILRLISENPGTAPDALFNMLEEKIAYKDFYNTLFRLSQQELISKEKTGWLISKDGGKTLQRSAPKKDGVWKLVIFDIPEKQKYVRSVLRAKLKSLHFKKWQNSIWISPFALDEEIEEELKNLGKKFFVRLIKTTDINVIGDLEKMF
jgi:DNA-binding transcriptional regulator PaaX